MKAWITRDEDGILHIWYKNKPNKQIDNCYHDGFWSNEGNHKEEITEQDLPEGINPQWSDNEPIEVELTIKMKG